ncbi:AzlC family ABC transporter permease [Rhizobium cremeum]|uniref:AzlC family ABC transporter permease n=1 Tax=Rhizobium cremeum TaxID=2813827 RepID=UPI000DDB1891|nr:AzlC family ABC transporter permease [Rhizobium cremeum]MCJ7994857.1 AzlC family ABC transporter permease [Rhizobium cremeum]MCJ8000147.1 AzlC family ABC transporter permease [Rhizobium cremeum]
MTSSLRQEFRQGFHSILPLTVAVVPIGLVFGAVAATKGLSPMEAMLMSALVFAGGSQFVAMDIWTHPANIAALGAGALLVNIRHVLMGTSISRHMASFSPRQKAMSMLLLADEIWAVAEFRARRQRLTPAWFFGAALPFYATWVLSGLFGALVGRLVGDPAVIAMDFAFPAVFVILIAGFWRGSRTGLILVGSAVSALLVHRLTPGVWYILGGALGGVAVAAIASLREREVRA